MEYKIDKAEVLRYLGAKVTSADSQTERLIEECASELCSIMRPKYIHRTFPLSRTEMGFTLDGCGMVLSGKTATERLSGCTSCCLMAATLGLEADVLIRKAQITDMARAVVYDACATDLIEKVCDFAEAEISAAAAANGLCTRNRFSPGYGDFPLDLQFDICNLLDTGRKIGVTLTGEFLLLPTKSVTAFIGIGNADELDANAASLCKNGCDNCSMKGSCAFCK